jgi:hypothetical protein
MTFYHNHVNHQATVYACNVYLIIRLMLIVANIYLRSYIEVGVRVGTVLPAPTQPKIPSD